MSTMYGSPRGFVKRQSVIDVINLLFLGAMIVLYLTAFTRTPYRGPLFVLYSLLLLLVLFMGRIRGSFSDGRLKQFVLFVYPVIFLFSIFETFYMLLPFFNEHRYDGLMASIDRALLGVDPTIWIEQWARPWLTELLSVFYLFYFPMPLIVLGWMFAKEKFPEVEEGFFTYLFCYYGAYLLYFFIPVEGPRFHFRELHRIVLDGYVLTEPIRRLIDALEPNKLDAFPSLHAAILTVTMIVAYRHNRRLFAFFVPCAAGILVSLVYLRYHYVIDVIAGLVWAFASILLAGTLYRALRRAVTPHFRSAGL